MLWIERAGQPRRTSEDGTPKPQAKGPKEAPLWGLAVLGAGARMANLDPPSGGPVNTQIATLAEPQVPLLQTRNRPPHSGAPNLLRVPRRRPSPSSQLQPPSPPCRRPPRPSDSAAVRLTLNSPPDRPSSIPPSNPHFFLNPFLKLQSNPSQTINPSQPKTKCHFAIQTSFFWPLTPLPHNRVGAGSGGRSLGMGIVKRSGCGRDIRSPVRSFVRSRVSRNHDLFRPGIQEGRTGTCI